MSIVHFEDECYEDIPSKNPIEVIKANQSFLEFMICQKLGEVTIQDAHRSAFWHNILDGNNKEVGQIDGDHDFNDVDIYDPAYYWFFMDHIEQYESKNPRMVRVECHFVKSQVPERKKE